MSNRLISFRWLRNPAFPISWFSYRLQAFTTANLLKMWKKRSQDLEARWML